MNIMTDNEMTFTMTSVLTDKDILNILGINDSSIGWSLAYTTFVQAKKHRKWRTNKKWLKRYGYKEVVVESDGWNVKESGGCMVTFEKEME